MDELVARMRAAREFWADLQPGKRVRLIRPTETEIATFLKGGEANTIEVGLDAVKRFATGWEGVTEIDLFGSAVGSDAPVEFTAERWAELLSDRMHWVAPCSQALIEAVLDRLQEMAASAKNSTPTSTRKRASGGKAKSSSR